ncbi:MAG: Gldg family protein [Clostridia bacterium]|nr:Gldg family protein [Clostridia bacterium]
MATNQTNLRPAGDAGKGKKNILKRGTLSVVYTVVFIALIIALNLVVSSISGSVNLTVDLTKENFISIGEVSRNILESLKENGDLDVTIYMLADRDKYDAGQTTIHGLNPLALVRDLCEQYAYEYEGIRVAYRNLDVDPEWATRYNELTNTTLTASHVVVEGKYHARVLSMTAFYVTNSETNEYVGFNGELRLTTAILQSCISEPQMISATTGHGESMDPSFASLLDGAGFDLAAVDLSSQDIDPKTKILIVSDPLTDFTDAEIEKLMDYTDAYNSLIVLVDDATPELPNLSDFLSEEWGIGYRAYHQVSDLTHSLNNNPLNLSVQYNDTMENKDGSAAYQLIKSLVSTGIRTIMPDSVALYTAPVTTKDRYSVEPVVSSSADAVTVSASAGTSETGAVPLMLLSANADYVTLNDENSTNQVLKYQYVLLIGSTSFAATGCIDSPSYGNRVLTLSALRTMAVERYSLDISYKTISDVALNVETGTATALAVMICAVLPGLILIAGIVVFFRRRHL